MASVSVLTALLAQIIGSNKGLLASAGVIVVYMTCSFTSLYSHTGQSVGISNIIFSRISVYLIGGLLLASIIITGVTLFAVNYFQIDYTQTRIFGYGSEEEGIRSVTSRSELFRANFIRHMEYSPIFGHTQVHTILDGQYGLYVHSTLSILPHLGIVGFLLFLLLIVGMYFEITRGNSNRRLDTLPNNAKYALFRLGMLAFVLAMGVYSAFFTWMPLWFSIGFFGTWFGFRASAISLSPKKRVRRKSGRMPKRVQAHRKRARDTPSQQSR